MIIRRISQGIKDQDWFVVAVEIMIVVVGIFIGLQVDDWNEGRKDRVLEREYMERLHAEIESMIVRNSYAVQSTERDMALIADLDLYFGQGVETVELANAHCGVLAQSHIFSVEISLPPTIRELISTGQILLISDEELRSRIIEFVTHVDSSQQLRFDVQSDRLMFARRYPNLITLKDNWEDTICDFAGLARRADFNNDYRDNISRRMAFNRAIVIGLQDTRQNLHSRLDFALGLEHLGEDS